MTTRRRGFTLIELLVVIAIIGILATLAVVNFGSARMKARDARRLADAKTLRMAVELYYDDNGVYPCVGAGNIYIDDQTTCLTTELVPTYLASVPVDPRWGGDGSATWGQDPLYNANTTSYSIRWRLEGAPVKQNSTYPNGTTCTGGGYPVCPWNGRDCVYVTGGSCNVFWFHLGGLG